MTIVVFAGIRALPGDPARALAGEESDPVTLAEIRTSFGLDQPLPLQYLHYVGNAVHGDLGRSARTGLPVASTIGHALPVTVQLAVFAMAIAVGIGVIAGVVAAVRRRSAAEWAANSVALLGLSVPNLVRLMAVLTPRDRPPGAARALGSLRSSTILAELPAPAAPGRRARLRPGRGDRGRPGPPIEAMG